MILRTGDLDSLLEGMKTDLGKAHAIARAVQAGTKVAEKLYAASLSALEQNGQYEAAAQLYLNYLDEQGLQQFKEEIDDWEGEREVSLTLEQVLPVLSSAETKAYVVKLAFLHGKEKYELVKYEDGSSLRNVSPGGEVFTTGDVNYVIVATPQQLLSPRRAYEPEEGINIHLLRDTAEFFAEKNLYGDAVEMYLHFNPDKAAETICEAIENHHKQEGRHKDAVLIAHQLKKLEILLPIIGGDYEIHNEEYENGIRCAEEIGDFESAYKLAVACFGPEYERGGEGNILAQRYKLLLELK